MRILFWTLTFWPNIGGMEVLAARLLPALRDHGHDFLVVAPQNYTDLPEQDGFQGIPIRRFPFQHATGNSIDHIVDVRHRVLQLKREFQADLVHVNGVGPMDFFHLVSKQAHPSPVLVTLHGDWGAQADGLVSRTLDEASWVVGCSAAILDRGRQVAPGIEARSSVIYNGIDASSGPVPRPVVAPRLLYVGRLADEKGADLAIDAFARVRAALPGARLTVAGDGPMRATLERRVLEVGLGHAVEFVGWVLPDRVAALMGEHAVVVMPSRQDSLPLVALEAGLMARPLVASRVGGLPEIVLHGRTGLLVDNEDVEGLAAAATRLLADPESAARMGRAARHRVEEVFGWPRHVSAYDALYRALVAAPFEVAALSR